MITVIHEQSETACATAHADGEQLWMGAEEFERATGWSLKPQGFCRGDICVPVPAARTAELVAGDAVNAAGFWRQMSNPVVHDAVGEVWVFGPDATERGTSLQSLDAPDFTLPDLTGAEHTLSEHRGKKVLLATWASW